jgi:hypothetical protein
VFAKGQSFQFDLREQAIKKYHTHALTVCLKLFYRTSANSIVGKKNKALAPASDSIRMGVFRVLPCEPLRSIAQIVTALRLHSRSSCRQIGSYFFVSSL